MIEETFKFFIAILSVMNPIGVVPTFVTKTDGMNPINIKKISKKKL